MKRRMKFKVTALECTSHAENRKRGRIYFSSFEVKHETLAGWWANQMISGKEICGQTLCSTRRFPDQSLGYFNRKPLPNSVFPVDEPYFDFRTKWFQVFFFFFSKLIIKSTIMINKSWMNRYIFILLRFIDDYINIYYTTCFLSSPMYHIMKNSPILICHPNDQH